jgi:hypothetical protein
MKHEVEDTAGAALVGRGRWIFGKAEMVDAAVSGAGDIGIEEKRRLVVAGVGALVADGIEDFGAENAGAFVAIQSSSREVGSALGGGEGSEKQHEEAGERESSFTHGDLHKNF